MGFGDFTLILSQADETTEGFLRERYSSLQ